jgi:hypothetical protein
VYRAQLASRRLKEVDDAYRDGKYSVNPFQQDRQALSHHHCGASAQVMRSCKACCGFNAVQQAEFSPLLQMDWGQVTQPSV